MISCPAGLAQTAQDLQAARNLHRQGELESALVAYRQLIADPTQTPADRGTAANNACVILLNSGRYPAALEACMQARDLRLESNDQPRLARTLNNLAAVLEASGQYEPAMARYLEALTINEQIEDWESVAINLANLGVLATQAGFYGSALNYYDTVEALAKEHHDEAWAPVQLSFAALNRGVVLERVGAFGEALDAFRSTNPALMSRQEQATVKINTGVAYRNLGDPFRALQEFSLAEALIPTDDPVALSNLWLDRALVQHLNLYDFAAAQTAYEKALELAETGGAQSEKLTTLYYLGRLHFDQGDPQRARALFQQVLEQASNIGAQQGQWSALEGLARISLAENRPNEALTQLQSAMDIIESTRAGLDEGRLRLEFFGAQRSVYGLAVEAAWQHFQNTGDSAHSAAAFAIVQRAKSRELLTRLDANASLQITEFAATPNELLLEYFFGENFLYLWVLSPDSLQMQQLGDATKIRDKIMATYQELKNYGTTGSVTGLSSLLTEPVAQLLTSSTSLRIAPDGLLFHLPFELLEANGNILLDNHIISYTPSAALHYFKNSTLKSKPVWSFAGFGAVDSDRHDLAGRYKLPALPGATQELQNLDQMLPGRHTLSLATQATEKRFFEVLSEGASIVHVASHTVFDDRLGPAIVLWPDNESDGLLFPQEIVERSFNIDLTVLAACSTAIGGIEDGRAIGSLTGALLSAGSSAVLATLWDINDTYTTFFMGQFYSELQKGLTPDVALANTKNQLRSQSMDNQSWAAFVLIGNSGPLIKTGPDFRFLAAGLILLLGWWLLSRRSN